MWLSSLGKKTTGSNIGDGRFRLIDPHRSRPVTWHHMTPWPVTREQIMACLVTLAQTRNSVKRAGAGVWRRVCGRCQWRGVGGSGHWGHRHFLTCRSHLCQVVCCCYLFWPVFTCFYVIYYFSYLIFVTILTWFSTFLTFYHVAHLSPICILPAFLSFLLVNHSEKIFFYI